MDIKITSTKELRKLLRAEAIEEFKQIYFQKYNVALSDNQAESLALKTILQIKATYKPMRRVNDAKK